ncbi:hypothetical protein DICA1_C12354 [Diutina catenulata]
MLQHQSIQTLPATPGGYMLKLDKVTKPKRGRKKTTQPPLTTANAKYPAYQESGPIPYEAQIKVDRCRQTLCLKKYITSALDPNRPYLTVYKYDINEHSVVWDYETGYVHLTGIWKAALSASSSDHVTVNSPATSYSLKADIGKLLESTPKRYQPYIKRVRGGLLRIQGTWMPYSLCKILCQRFCYHIRYELVPIFGPDYPETCLSPNSKGFGELKLDSITSDDNLEMPVPTPAPAPSLPVATPFTYTIPQPMPHYPRQEYSLPVPYYTQPVSAPYYPPRPSNFVMSTPAPSSPRSNPSNYTTQPYTKLPSIVNRAYIHPWTADTAMSPTQPHYPVPPAPAADVDVAHTLKKLSTSSSSSSSTPSQTKISINDLLT